MREPMESVFDHSTPEGLSAKESIARLEKEIGALKHENERLRHGWATAASYVTPRHLLIQRNGAVRWYNATVMDDHILTLLDKPLRDPSEAAWFTRTFERVHLGPSLSRLPDFKIWVEQ